jgi:mono/diheme cytochrome c family protein
MLTRVIIALFTLVVAFAILGADQPKIKRVPPSATSPASGKQMFESYCAACHGKDGKGGGPAVAALKVPPPDLTTMNARNGGKFPELKVFGLIHGDVEMPAAHGSKDMPVWGTVFQSMSHDNGASTQMRLANLTAYIKSLQK